MTKKTKIEKREKQEHFRLLFDSAPDPYYMMDTHGIIHNLNKAAELFLGYKRKEIIGKNFAKLKLLSARQLPKALANIARNIAGQSTKPNEYKMTRKDGKEVDVEIRTQPVKINGKNMILGIGRDISERKKNEEELEDKNLLLEKTGELAKIGGWEFYPKTNKVTWTDETYRIHDIPIGKEVSLSKALNFFPAESKKKIRKAMKQAIEKGIGYDLELDFKTEKGEKKTTRSICTPITKNGKIVKLFGIFQDITQETEAKQIAKEEKEKFQTLFEKTKNSMLILEEKDGQFIDCNHATLELFGFKKREDFIGLTPWKLSPLKQEDGQNSKEKGKALINGAKAKSFIFFEWVHQKKNGERFFAEVQLSRIKLNGEGVIQATIRDITDAKANESKLKEKVEQMKILNSANLRRHKELMNLRKENRELKNKLKK